MKKLLSIILVLMFCAVMFAHYDVALAQGKIQTYDIWLTTSDSGSTTAASGTSTMVISGAGINRSLGMTTLNLPPDRKIDLMLFQLYDATLADAYTAAANSGATMTVKFAESIYDTSGHWTAAGTTTLLNGVALSGTSKRVMRGDPAGLGSLRFYFTTGVTPFGAVTGTVKLYFAD